MFQALRLWGGAANKKFDVQGKQEETEERSVCEPHISIHNISPTARYLSFAPNYLHACNRLCQCLLSKREQQFKGGDCSKGNKKLWSRGEELS